MQNTTLKQQLQMSITLACLKDENKFEDGDINWNYVDADVTMDYPNAPNDLIVELLNKTADEYYKTIGRNKAESTALRNIDFTSGMVECKDGSGWVVA